MQSTSVHHTHLHVSLPLGALHHEAVVHWHTPQQPSAVTQVPQLFCWLMHVYMMAIDVGLKPE
jgi:hypothetical protein